MVLAFAMTSALTFGQQPMNPEQLTTMSTHVDRPEDITFDFAITGIVHGNFTIGLGAPGPYPPTWSVSPPAGTTMCSNWAFHSSNIHVWCPTECKTCLNQPIGLVYRGPAGGDWIAYDGTTLGAIDTSHCCSQPPPTQHCNGIWDMGVVRPQPNPCP